jgi:hypothetical protein
MLTYADVRCTEVQEWLSALESRCSLYLLYWYRRTHTAADNSATTDADGALRQYVHFCTRLLTQKALQDGGQSAAACERGAERLRRAAPVLSFTRFTSTTVQKLTQKALQERVGAACGERSVNALTYADVC